ncbi:hypothetical protein V6R21_28215 [Limibacter armeniacum]|uniref:hypothetical protein n=1 Tax=Limibacter armeniacum TaxID=466084 RepID=UPI002FE50285
MYDPYQIQHLEKKRKRKRYYQVAKTVLWLSKPLMLVALPFFLLIRGSIFFYQYTELHTYLSFVLAFAATLFVLVFYVSFIYRKVLGRKFITLKEFKWKVGVTSVVLLGYCVFAFFSFSSKHTKHTEIQEEYTSLHPFLRLGARTLLFLDKDLLITDAKRFPEDYKKMGLPTKKNSLHYIQQTGYAHAMDIRVNGRSFFRNWLVAIYFRLLGFNVLRHVGTADHLHISLSLPELPYRI